MRDRGEGALVVERQGPDKGEMIGVNDMGVYSIQGKREYQEDRFWLKNSGRRRCAVAAVFDGNGGFEMADFACRKTVENLDWLRGKRDRKRAFEELFNWMDSNSPSDEAGTTATVCLIEAGKLTVASVGDSPAFLVEIDKKGGLTTCKLTRDHHPDDPIERKRIENKGGYVIEGRTPRVVTRSNSRLALSRCLGIADGLDGKISCRPDVVEINLSRLRGQVFLVVASDGASTPYSDVSEIGKVVAGSVDSVGRVVADLAAENLVNFAVNRHVTGDNATAIVVRLN